MTQDQFTNGVDGTINDFVNGVIDGKEFRCAILDHLILVAKPHFQECTKCGMSSEYNFIKSQLLPSDEDNGVFNTFNEIVRLYKSKTGRKDFDKENMLAALTGLGFKFASYRKPYAREVTYGFWIELID